MAKKGLNRRLKSFTLTEVIISLAISAILISLVVKLFTIFSDAQKNNNRIMSDYEEIIRTEYLLSRLMSESDSIHFNDHRLTFYKDNNEDKSLSFYDSLIVFNNSGSFDTFHLKIGEIHIEFNPFASSILQSISFSVFYSNQVLPINIIKQYEGRIIVNSQIYTNEN